MKIPTTVEERVASLLQRKLVCTYICEGIRMPNTGEDDNLGVMLTFQDIDGVEQSYQSDTLVDTANLAWKELGSPYLAGSEDFVEPIYFSSYHK